jgi:TPR repeat protein
MLGENHTYKKIPRLLQPLVGFCCILLAGCVTGPSKADLTEIQRKAKAGDPTAQMLLGEAYDFGYMGKRNYAEAARWYQLAADQGNASAQNSLGSLYEHGLGVETNYTKALEFYRKSAEQGFAMAQNSLGRMYDMGMGVATNYVEANSWYRRAAEQGDPQAMFNLGLNYGFGQGVPQDRVQAFMWLDLARWLTQLSPDMKTKWTVRRYLDDLKKLMTPAQIKEGERLSKEWSSNYIKRRKKA